MTHTEHDAKTKAAQTGLFALLSNLLPARGSGAPSARASALVLIAFVLALLAPSAASAHFVRPFLHQTTGIHAEGTGEITTGSPVVKSVLATKGFFSVGQRIEAPGIPAPTESNPTGTTILAVEPGILHLSADATQTNLSAELSAQATISPGGLAVDAADELWAGEHRGGQPLLDRFQPSGAFQEALPLSGADEVAEQLAIDPATGAFYVSAKNKSVGPNYPGEVEIFSHAGALQHQIGLSELEGQAPAAIAFDPSTGSLYVVNESQTPTLFKFDAAGAKASFAGCLTCGEYVSGSKVTGAPGANKLLGAGSRIAVDPASGDVYVSTVSYGAASGPAILEYAPSGEFLRAITSEGVPRPPGAEHCCFGGDILGLAVDPSNGDLLLSVGFNISFAVDEFDSSGHFLGQITEAAGLPLEDAEALALDSTGHLYLDSRIEGFIDAYGPGGFVPALHLAATSGRTQTAAVLNGAVNPESPLTPNPSEYGVADCHFEYVTEAAFNETGFSNLSSGGEAPCTEPAAPAIPKTNAFTPVHAAIAGLASGSTYRYRLAATLSGAISGGPEHSASLAFTAPAKPAVSATAANQVTSTFADLLATVNPLGADTTYRFEYLTQAAYEADGNSFGTGTTSVPSPPADLGPGGPTGSSPEAVLQHLGGLSPATTYRFRLTAENEVGPTTGEELTFTTQAPVSPGLPDNRAYELLTPPDKEGAEDLFRFNGPFVEEDHERGLASESGDQVMLETRAAFGPFPASANNVYSFSRRLTPGGSQPARWDFTSLASPALGVQTTAIPGAFDPADFSRLAFMDGVGAAESPAGYAATALLGPPGGPYATLHTEPGIGLTGTGERTNILGGSRDLGHLVFETMDHSLAPAAAGLDPGAPALYEWQALGLGGCTALAPGFDQASGGCISLLNVKTNGELLSKCGAGLGFGRGQGGGAYRAVSADGSRAFLTAPAPWEALFSPARRNLEGAEGCNDPKDTVNHPQLYLRSGGETFEVSEPQPLAELKKEKGKYQARYVGASADGSRVFFASEAWLTADHPSAHDPELYEWRLPAVPGSAGPGAQAGPCEEASPDWVPASQGCLARVSAPQSANAPAELRKVTAVSADGSAVYFAAYGALAPPAAALPPALHDQDGAPINLYRYDTATATNSYIATIRSNDYLAFCSEVTPCPGINWSATPDGRYLLFSSGFQLTAEAHNAASGCHVYLSEGVRSTCDELYRYDAQTQSLLCVSCDPAGAPPASNSLFTQSVVLNGASYGPPRGISNDGAYAFFDTESSLVPQDSNGTWDVYEWHGGKISLLSSGVDSSPSFFLDASPDGKNVFFGTHARLVPQDTDTKGDLYDARVCTESEPCISAPPGKEGLCEGDACSHPVPAPNRPTLATSAPKAAGNVHEPPVNHKHHKKHHRKHHKSKKRHAKVNRGGGK